MLLVTGAAGFIGSSFVLDWLATHDEPVVSLDKLTYAGNRASLAALDVDARHTFVHGDICDAELVASLLARYRPRAIVHLAAESHVDRSIHGPAEFVQTNVVGTLTLLEAARAYVAKLEGREREAFRFLHVSTDEVFGSLGPDEPPFSETTPYAPNSPYSASKAGSDHLVRAYHHTYDLATLTTNCSNNYGPRQFPEKLIPFMLTRALAEQSLPLYGDGKQRRDWLYVGDHVRALVRVLEAGRPGCTYNIGGNAERDNLELVRSLCGCLDALRPRARGRYEELITFVQDRPGHDRRYAMDCRKLTAELGWHPRESLASGLEQTVRWYLDNAAWLAAVQSGEYRRWVSQNYASRAGSTT